MRRERYVFRDKTNLDPVLLLECASCGRYLAPEAFVAVARMRHGRSSYCRACAVERNRRWRAEHPESDIAYNDRRRAAYHADLEASRTKAREDKRARRGPLPAPRVGRCAVCGTEFTTRQSRRLYCSKRCYWRVKDQRERERVTNSRPGARRG